MNNNMNDKPFYYDEKNSKASDVKNFDKLNLGHYADALTTFIDDCETPMTIGLQGDWGIGKTSLLNMLKQKLKAKKDEYPIVEFNTWQYSLFGEDEYLGLSAINSMIDLVKSKFSLEDEKYPKLKEASNKIKSALKTIKFGFGPISIDPTKLKTDNKDGLDNIPYVDISEQMKELKTIFNQSIQTIVDDRKIGKIIFFIDV